MEEESVVQVDVDAFLFFISIDDMSRGGMMSGRYFE